MDWDDNDPDTAPVPAVRPPTWATVAIVAVWVLAAVATVGAFLGGGRLWP